MAGFDLIRLEDDEFKIIDQRKLPNIEYFIIRNINEMCFAIKNMVLRGAPLIGIAAAFGIYLGVKAAYSEAEIETLFLDSIYKLTQTRPTAVNLNATISEAKKLYKGIKYLSVSEIIDSFKNLAFEIWEKQKAADVKIGEFGCSFLSKKKVILTHCNTGTLATGGIGTALGIIKVMHKKNYIDYVLVDETRPYMQGLRLTAFELQNENINYKVITDSAAGFLMRLGYVDAVVVGADRIAKNGDTANKIGTYSLAVLSKRHNVPFIVAAPESTIDRNTNDMNDIFIEKRDEDEVLKPFGLELSPKEAHALNYSFDLTDGELIDAIITEKGVYKKPYRF